MVTVVAAVVIKSGRVLLCSRPVDKPPRGLEFPGGKVEPGERLNAALRRELREELGVSARIGAPLYLLRRGKLKIWFLRADLNDEKICLLEGQEAAIWVRINSTPPDGILANDLEFWKFLSEIFMGTENFCSVGIVNADEKILKASE